MVKIECASACYRNGTKVHELSGRWCIAASCPYSTTQFNTLAVCCFITHLYSTSLPNTNHVCVHNS